jgi:mRNA interferase MazF
MTCSPGDLVLIPFPYADLSSSKKRPVLALTAPDRHGDFIALAITSVQQTQYAIELRAQHLIQGALPKTSWVRLDKVFTLSESSLVKTLGKVDPAFMQETLAGLYATVGYVRGE